MRRHAHANAELRPLTGYSNRPHCTSLQCIFCSGKNRKEMVKKQLPERAYLQTCNVLCAAAEEAFVTTYLQKACVFCVSYGLRCALSLDHVCLAGAGHQAEC